MGAINTHFVPALDGVAYGLLLFVAAAGLTLLFGIGGVLNIAHGTLFALGGYLAASVSDGSWSSAFLGLAVATVGGTLGGGLLAAGTLPLADRGHLPQALLTFGLSLVGADVLTTVYGTDEHPVVIPKSVNGTVQIFGHVYPTYRLMFIVVASVLALAGTYVLGRTRAGALLRAAADDREMVGAMGYAPWRVHAALCGAAGALAGLAGGLGAPIIGPGPDTADKVLMLSMVVIVLGRPGSVLGAFGAAIAVGEIETLGVSISSNWAPYLLFGLMAVALVVRTFRGSSAVGAGAAAGAHA
ncbi:branched-chain amino acid ABC transporter permease [Catenulispora pinisilvae]|uniref:branched-chain amino acid ABC transporter permease n=1 Tax=Catenulispora pinisilvae TaxID=2705253 RepID=UPI001891B145|nr:branched-chain amino acid ABC transporter permease [Catenulispora pinisilvae]